MTAQRATDLLSRRFDTRDQALMTRWVSQRIGSVVAASAFRFKVGPNAVTVTGLLIMLVACVPYVLGDAPADWILAAVLWQIGFAFDCADGQLARATGTTGPFGAWLDVACDHVRLSAQVLAVLLVFIRAGVTSGLAFGVAFVLLAGLSVYLHTATVIKVGHASAELPDSGAAGLGRTVLRTLLDSPLFFLVLCLLRPWPCGLLAYCVVFGLLVLFRGGAVGYFRLRG